MTTELSPLRAARAVPVDRAAVPVDRAARARFAASRRAGAILDEVAEATGDDDAAEFDPAEHNIEDVLKFVDEHEGSAAAIAALERAGKARVTLLTALDEIIEQDDDEGADD